MRAILLHTVQELARRRPTVNVKQLIMEEFERPCCIRGYHIYQEVWTAGVALVSNSLREQSVAMESTATRVYSHTSVANNKVASLLY